VAPASAPVAKPTPAPAARKLSYKEQRELQEMPARIEALEAKQRAIGERLASASLYTDEPQRVGELQARYAQIDDELLQALERWELLSAR
jgi:ATP-binding cassette subfamily F protein uup